ncbi:unnamed protein product [Linum tenue]|uniref:C2H2-type domain-containing protein n=1 Tax=Linum tenue TaxID=586396 RepID=A0AAV0R848_9ROSI|nr:unnamed protein product [Linum tenue]CAI0553710.1 unnamed protein product [Linum tenue]
MFPNLSSSSPPSSLENETATAATNKRKRRPAGTPDPDAEVVSLSARTLMESDRYVCEICNQGFQREQNLQMHRSADADGVRRGSSIACRRVWIGRRILCPVDE